MTVYYTILSVINWTALLILCTLVYENNRLTKESKRRFYRTYLFIMIASAAEWIGVMLSGSDQIPVLLFRFIKFWDYAMTPLAGAAFVAQMGLKNVWSKLMTGVVIFNSVFQFIAIFTGWMTTLDSQHEYHHGPLYFIYILVYLTVVVIVVAQFLHYGKFFRKQNRISLYLIMTLALGGIAIQEIGGKGIRTAYLTLVFGAALMFIHTSEFYQQRSDEQLQMQHRELRTDALTGLLSRFAYENDMREYGKAMPQNLTVFCVDINGLKTVNDTLGHDAGDELIRGAADCVEKVFVRYGSCYRTGGDEYVVFAEIDSTFAADLLHALRHAERSWKGKTVPQLRLAVGCAASAEHPDMNLKQLIAEADRKMYEEKTAYYMENGLERRRS